MNTEQDKQNKEEVREEAKRQEAAKEKVNVQLATGLRAGYIDAWSGLPHGPF